MLDTELGTKNIVRLTFEDLETMSYPSVTDYCRYLEEHLDIYASVTTVEVYRGEMLCLTVKDIKKAATLQPVNCRWMKYDKRRNKGSVEARTAI